MTPITDSPLPAKQTCVSFSGVDWAVEQKKTQEGHERRKKEQQRRAGRRKLKSFLQYLVSPEGHQLISMAYCNFLLEIVEEDGVVTFSEGLSNAQKVGQLLEEFDGIKAEKDILIHIQSWMDCAVRKGFYSLQSEKEMSKVLKSFLQCVELQSFLQYVVSPEGNRISQMGHCGLLLQEVEEIGVVTFSEGLSNVQKAGQLLEELDGIKAEKDILTHIQSWMDCAVRKGFYSPPTFPSLETYNAATYIIEAAVFAAYAKGKHRNHSHGKLCEDLSKIFQMEKFQCFDALADAKMKDDWTDLFDDGEVGTVGSHSSESYIDELASAATTEFARQANEFNLTYEQIDTLSKYCFVSLKQDS